MRRFLFFVTFIVMLPAIARADLRADEIAIIVNRNSPDSAALADFYVKARMIPDGRIIELDLPTGDDITFEQYQNDVLPQVRQFLESHQLRDKVRCIVTMFGVPLRISARTNLPADDAELKNLTATLDDSRRQLAIDVGDLEHQAALDDPSFRAKSGDAIDAFAQRLDWANQSLILSAQRTRDLAQRQQKLRALTMAIQKFRLPTSTNRSDPGNTTVTPTTLPTAAQAAEFAKRPFDPDARHQLRMLVARQGIIRFARTVEAQIEFLTTADTDSSFDNELALIWWPDYPRSKWLVNPLHYRFMRERSPRVIMTMRLDGPDPQAVRDIIAASVLVERDGLKGGVVIDGGGSGVLDPQHKQVGFSAFESQFGQLASLLKSKTKLKVDFDEKTDVLPAHSVKDVAIYTGWYSVGKYVPSCTFSRGAVAYHVASYEMTTLHDPNTHEWCRSLISDGAVATIGPVSEPFLHAFPLPVDFVPLLLTGKLSLAEIYWRTTPLVSWKMCAVGDPLYTPYRANPGIVVSDLRPQLQQIFQLGAESHDR